MSVLALAAPLAVRAQTTPAAPTAQAQPQPNANEQVVVPKVERRDVKLPRFASKDIELSAFAGTYASENFGANPVVGLRLGYHITEDLFVQASYGQTRVSDDAFRQILPSGVFPTPKQTLKYANLSVGVNVLPGEVFIGRNNARASQLYLLGGIGSTTLVDQRRQTINFGAGLRVYLAERWSVQLDMRDHIFSLDILGKRQSTQNLELTGGLSYFF